jgi:hypothetical protein
MTLLPLRRDFVKTTLALSSIAAFVAVLLVGHTAVRAQIHHSNTGCTIEPTRGCPTCNSTSGQYKCTAVPNQLNPGACDYPTGPGCTDEATTCGGGIMGVDCTTGFPRGTCNNPNGSYCEDDT